MSEEEKPPGYWEGVKDTLRLLHQFIDWKEDHPDSPVNLKRYIMQAIDKVAPKTKPRLRDLLGIPFKQQE